MGWKNILKLRDRVRKYVMWKLGNGKSVDAQYDQWNQYGPLCDYVTSRDLYDARMHRTYKVPDLI